MTVVAVLVMLALPIMFAWVPVPGIVGLVAGLIGGYLIGRPGRAFLYALLPFGIIAGLIVAAGFGIGLLVGPVGAVAGGAVTAVFGALAFFALMVDNIALLLGAAVGGAIRQARRTDAVARPAAPAGTSSTPAGPAAPVPGLSVTL
jgi:hypothetical protein